MRSNIMIFALGGFLCCFSLSSLQAHFCIVSILPNSDERGGHLIFFVLHGLVLHVSDLFVQSQNPPLYVLLFRARYSDSHLSPPFQACAVEKIPL